MTSRLGRGDMRSREMEIGIMPSQKTISDPFTPRMNTDPLRGGHSDLATLRPVA